MIREMANKENLIPAQKGEVRNPAGKPPGTRNRSTIARKFLEMAIVVPDSSLKQLKSYFPDLPETLTAEDLSTLIQLMKSITKQDTNAYNAVLNSAYGLAKQPLTGEDGGPIDVRHGLSLTVEDLKVFTEYFDKNF